MPKNKSVSKKKEEAPTTAGQLDILFSGPLLLVPAVSGREPRSKVNHLQIISMTLQDGEDLIVGNNLRRVLNKARKQSAG